MVRILNFDNSIIRQQNLIRRFQPLIVDLARIGPACRMSMSERMAEEIRRVLEPALRGSTTFLGSGDFHHVSSVLIEQFTEPISVIVFDHHPDWDTLPPKLHCAAWVTNVLRMQNVKKLVLLGVSSEDISDFRIQTGNLRALKDDRVEIYPYRHRPTRTFLKRVPDNRSIRVERGLFSSIIHWQELGKQNIPELFSRLFENLETKRVYVSIDKDCLTADHSLTNWEQGYFSLEELLMLLRLIKTRLEIVGLDIVGDYSPPVVNGWAKATLARIDRPRDYSARGKSEGTVDAVNERTNVEILELLTNRSG